MGDNFFTPLLTTTDWNDEWIALQASRARSYDAKAWDERAKTFPVKHGSQAGYVQRFLEFAGILPGETVLDMGCGTGAIATPLAQQGHRVIACDFSRGMLDAMEADQRDLGVEGVEVHLMSWTDDWNAFGLVENSVDVALASRSVATCDLRDSLMRLDRVARRRVCITIPCGPSPKIDAQLLKAAGIDARLGRDFLYAFNILAANAINPEVRYIDSSRTEVFGTAEQAHAAFADIVIDAARNFMPADELASIPERLDVWLSENLVHDQSGWHLKRNRRPTWAFIAWTPGGSF